MADERTRQLERAFAADPGSPLLRAALAHQRCRTGEHCAHFLNLEELDTKAFSARFAAMLREHSRRQLENTGSTILRTGELRLTPGGEPSQATLISLSNFTCARVEIPNDDNDGAIVVLLMVEHETGWLYE